MAFDATLSVRAVRPVFDGLRAHGLDIEPTLRLVGLDQATLADPDARIGHGAAVAIWADAVERSGDDDFGLHAGEAFDMTACDVLFYAYLSSANPREGLARVDRLFRLEHDAARIEIADEGADLAVVRHALPGGMSPPRQVIEYILCIWARAMAAASGAPAPIREVRFVHPAPSDTSEHRRLFGAPLRFAAAQNGLVVPRSFLSTPHIKADATLVSVLERHASDLLSRLPQAETMADRVRAVLVRQIAHQVPDAGIVASQLGMSVRTLSRRLSQEGTTLRTILDETRAELARAYLLDRDMSISEAAFLLGFSEPSAFNRAFKRWFDTTPGEFRSTSARHRDAGHDARL